VLHEIGRLREVTFRAVGEGTGREIDLDRFDSTYLHLFVWDRARSAIAGAYRLGPTDRILAAKGIDGLYSSTLFTYRKVLFERMGPALEMGRSFIAEPYQRSYAGLLLLWRGIGELVVRNPKYTTLFGPVSISADYRSISHRLMAEFLRQNRFAHRWGRWVRPRSPLPRGRLPVHSLPTGVEELSEVIAELESDRKGVPVLLRQYLKLGGRQLALNVDEQFSNVLDVLVMVDLRETDERMLVRYLGRDGAASFRHVHAVDSVGVTGVAR
jgi:putative hemolysin